MQKFGVGFLPYFPLGGGLLSGKYKRGAALPEGARLTETKRSADRFLTERNWSVVERLQALADERGHSLLDVRDGLARVAADGIERDRRGDEVRSRSTRTSRRSQRAWTPTCSTRIDEITRAARHDRAVTSSMT